MAGNKQKTPLSIAPDGTLAGDTAPHAPKARAPLAVRIILTVIAGLLACVATLAAVNLRSVDVYNTATQALGENLDAVEREDADLDALALKQQQVDSQFKDAATFDPLLLPHLRSSIDTNTAISKDLTERIKRMLTAQHGGGDDDAASASPSSAGTGQNSSSTDATQGLSDEQRKKIADLLKANQNGSTDPGSSSSTQKSQDDTDSSVKPW